MGFPYHELIPAAILFDNPGITREEFLDLLNKTYSFPYQEFKKNDPWDSFEQREQDYYDNLEHLASVLSLGDSKKYKLFQKPSIDGYGLKLYTPSFRPLSEEEQKLGHKYVIRLHVKNIIKKPKILEEISFYKLDLGSVWRDYAFGGEGEGIVTKIFKETCLGKVKDSVEGDSSRWNYKMEIKPFYPKFKREFFNSKEEVYKRWPQFHPDFIYHWSKRKGIFSMGLNDKDFLWTNQKGKYYLDNETFNYIHARFFCGGKGFGYTDLILTSEAIKHKAWKVLSSRGLKHLPQFLDDFPDAKPVYEKAVLDSHTSLYAKQQGLIISEFLRKRLLWLRID